MRYTFFGLFNFQAPYLPWVLVLLSVLFNGSVVGDIVGEDDKYTYMEYGDTAVFTVLHLIV